MTARIDKQLLQDKAWEILILALEQSECTDNELEAELDNAIHKSYNVASKFLSFDIKTLKKMGGDK